MRTRRRLAVGGTALVAIAAAGCHGTPTVTPPVATSPCARAATLDHPDLRTGTAVWARFCPGRGPAADAAAGLALVPAGVLTHDAASVVGAWQGAIGHHVEFGCGAGSEPSTYRVQIGFADGTVGELDADTGGCPADTGTLQIEEPYRVYASLVTALGRQDAPASQATTTGPPPCPPSAVSPPTTRTPWTGGLLMDQDASLGQRCRYVDGVLTTTTALSAGRAEALRVAVDGGVLRGGSRPVVPRHSRRLTEYAVTLLDRSAAGTTFWVLGDDAEVYVATSGALLDLGGAGAYVFEALGTGR